VEAATAACPTPARRLLTSPAGRRFDQAFAAELARQARLLIVCGHYEGVDERIAVGLNLEEVSIGDYVLTGGEPAAVVVVDATVRLLPGALGNPAGTQDESFSAGLLEYPQYTRPRSFRGMEVPPVLLSGDHAAIAEWRRRQSQERTRRRRGSAERPQGPGPTQEGGQSS
jgi:tRNA (guanine37-N1)-methyltransferase